MSHCAFKGTTNGIRFKANRTNGGLVQHCVYSDITMDNVQYPILITSYYEQTFSSSDPSQPVTSTTPLWKNIAVRNLVSTNSKDAAITLQGLPEMPIQNLTFANASFAGSKNFSIAHAHGVNFFNTTYNGASTGLASSPVDATIHQLTITGQPKSQSINVGSPLTLTVAATADFTPIFQWYHDGLSLGNSFGANSASLVLSAIRAEDAGSYSVSLGDSAGSILSDSAIIVVKGGDAVLPKLSGKQSTTPTPSNNQYRGFIDPSGRFVPGIASKGKESKGIYLSRNNSGKWTPYVRVRN